MLEKNFFIGEKFFFKDEFLIFATELIDKKI